MNGITVHRLQPLSRTKLFLALSRTHHGLIDLATPALGALLWLGTLPPPETVLLGLMTAFAGYTAVYALNDVVDYRSDERKIRGNFLITSSKDVDGVYVRHPLAQGLLSLKAGLGWTAAWALLALMGAYLLNPVCAAIFLVSCALEAAYCLLLTVTYLRTVISGVVKTSGGIAAVYAVDPYASPLFLTALFLTIFFWEIGGQNVPNDWADLEEDRKLESKTLPAQLGIRRAQAVMVGCLALAVALSVSLFWLTQADLHHLYPFLALAGGSYLLLIPAWRLRGTEGGEKVSQFFSAASYYPLMLLGVVIICLVL
jgi:4-hydroxybenzoate polyprenyltransferase